MRNPPELLTLSGPLSTVPQTMRKGEPMADVLIGKNCSSHVPDDWMDFDLDTPGVLRVKRPDSTCGLISPQCSVH